MITLNANYAISENSENEVAALIVFNAVELKGFSWDVNILNIYFGGDDKGVSNKLSLNNIPLQRHSLDDFQLIAYENCFLKAYHTAQLASACPDNVDHDIIVI